ncbi:MAG TPA: TcfC E-set like domain-containing protein, partial [Croceibacterium sp.]|nr:TcfC E-set like domain-containing protein [Croceibacterium sp.]
MHAYRISASRARIRRVALCCTMLAMGGAWPLAARAADAPPVAISVGEPEGFANLTEAHTLLVDVYFGGTRKGEAKITTAPGSVTFEDPAALLALLPGLSDRATVAAALGGSLPANSQLACSITSDPAQCGRLSPDVAGVIFDRDHFRIDVFLNPRFISVHDNVEEAYIPDPQEGLAMINQVAAVVSGDIGKAATFYNFQDSIVLANGERRLRADLSYANEVGFGAERLAFEWDRPGLRYSAGAIWAPGSEIAGRRKLLGLGVESQIDTRLDRDKMLGSPIVVYLDQRARVDIVRDGRVLYSAIHEAGNQEIDTSNLPDGSYEVTLRIDEPGRPAREERRFFSKSRLVPSLGRTDFFVYGGLLVDEADAGSLDPSDHPYLQGGIAHRLGENWALSGGIEASDIGASAEIAATYITPIALVRAAAVADDDGTYGAILQLMSAGTSRLSFSFDLRRIEADADVPMPLAPVNPLGAISLRGSFGSYSQANGVISYGLDNLRFFGSFAYRDDADERERYSIGPAVEWDVMRRGRLLLTLRGDATATERGNAGFAGVQLRMIGGRSTITALAGGRATGIAGDDIGEGGMAAVSGALAQDVAGGELSLGAGYEHQPRQDNFVASTEFRHRLATFAGDLSHSDRAAGSVTQYSVGLQTTFAAGAGALEIAGKATNDSMIVARVDGAQAGDRFDVL